MLFLFRGVSDVNVTCKGHTGRRKEALRQQFEKEAFPEINKSFEKVMLQEMK